MKIVCDNCSTKYSIADEKVRGKVFKIKCKKCSHIIVVKGQEVTGEGQPAGFDQKETRVFDYSGFEGKQEGAGAGGGAAEPIWHLVIDREQVGPLTVAEVSQKWTSGEIDLDTYGWREGFADWQRLGAIDELAAVLRQDGSEASAGRADPGEHASATGEEPTTTAEGPAGLFGDGSATPASGVPSISGRTDPTDLFAGAGTSTEDELPAADLFGGGSSRAAGGSSQPQVFASSAAAPARRSQPKDDYGDSDGGGLAVASGGSREAGPTMTAQRNENSVLFSLNNLSALAGASEAAAPSPRASIPGSSFSSGPEGSGLIDIRAMAAMTLGAKKEDAPRARSTASDDDLPVFSASSFSAPAAGVLLPTVQPQSNRMMYIVLGVFGLLIVTAIVLLAVIVLGKKSPASTTGPAIGEVASSTSPPPSSATPTAPTPSSPTAPTPSSPTAPPPSSPTAPPPSSPNPAVTPPVVTPNKPAKPDHEKPTKPTPTNPTPTNPTKPPSEPTTTKPSEPPAPRTEPAVKPQKCDEVACLVTPDLPCCPKKGQSKPTASPADSSLPDRLDQSDIIAGMKTVNGRVNACNDKYPGSAAFKVKVTVSSDGGVQSASAGAPLGGPAASCVEAAVKGARFKRTKNSITFNYPYTFR